jgi:hypothetical protein
MRCAERGLSRLLEARTTMVDPASQLRAAAERVRELELAAASMVTPQMWAELVAYLSQTGFGVAGARWVNAVSPMVVAEPLIDILNDAATDAEFHASAGASVEDIEAAVGAPLALATSILAAGGQR